VEGRPGWATHRAPDTGSADSAVPGRPWSRGGLHEIDGPTNRAACDFIHRGIVLTEPIPPLPSILWSILWTSTDYCG